LLITNNDKDRELIFFTKRSRMFDDFGNEYEPSKGELANKQVGSRSDARSLLISGIPTKASLTFKNVTQEASGISLLEIRCYEQESGEFKIKFRNIPLSK